MAYYQRLTTEVRRKGARLDLTIVQADVDELVRNNRADDRAAQAKVYLELIERLKSAGADCVAITSLGGHFCYDETVEKSPLPLVSGVDPLDTYFASRGLKVIGLLGTEVVMRTRLYGQLEKTRAVVPSDNLVEVGDTYRDMAIRGASTDADRVLLIGAGQRMVDDQGADAIVLAGTDLGLAFDGHDTSYKVVDALDVHVALLADLACGTRTLN